MLQSVQKFGLKVCLKQWHSIYENLIDQAGIPSLAVRRKLLKLCQLYNILNGHVNFHNLPTYSRPTLFVNRIRSVHLLSLSFSHSNFQCSSFSPSAISLWNTLPRDIFFVFFFIIILHTIQQGYTNSRMLISEWILISGTYLHL